MALSKEQRDKLPADDFAVPGKRKMPMHDATHVKLAWDMVDRTGGLTPEERTEARHRILHRAKELGVETKDWHVEASLSFEAMAIDIPAFEGHPNRHPFSGVMTFLDRPSENPVGGAKGHHTFIPKAVAEKALPSLLGMAVDFKPEFDGHDKTSKIGIITEANVDGDCITIAGFLYAADFPKEVERIRAEKDALGFSYEAQARIQSLNADPWVLEACTFTGAAILYKDRAAYTQTSLAAQAVEDDAMTPEEMKKLLGEAIAPLAVSVTELATKVVGIEKAQLEAVAVREKVREHAEKLRSCAAAMEAAGIGTHATQGHVNVLRHMAASIEAEATMGNVPHVYRDHDFLSRTMEAEGKVVTDPELKKSLETIQASLDGAKTELADLKAKGFNTTAAPERKTLSPEITALLTKLDLSAAANDGKLTVAMVDKALEGLPREARIEQKVKLLASGALAA